MPILKITAVESPEYPLPSRSVLQRIGDDLGEVFGAQAGSVWVQLHALAQDHYVENLIPAAETPSPIFLSVLMYQVPTLEARAALATAIADCVGQALNRPAELVHILFEPPAKGRIAFGGKLRG